MTSLIDLIERASHDPETIHPADIPLLISALCRLTLAALPPKMARRMMDEESDDGRFDAAARGERSGDIG